MSLPDSYVTERKTISPGIPWKAKIDQENIIFPSIFWFKERPYFPSLKSLNEELLSNQ